MWRAAYVLSIWLYLFSEAGGIPRLDPLVATKVGLLKGLGAPDGDYSMFLGIPYATVDPLNPFGPSTPHPGFETTFEAVHDSPVCPQREIFNNTLVGSLDCLRINVYVPNTASSKKPLPVFVWIHGGGFSRGDGGRYNHGPKFLVKHDVIVVTFNYRLGAYGFLCLDDPRVPGNQALKDQLAALRWIKKNIDAFGGDSNKITIAGQSAGGVSVDFHLTYTNEDLFHNVILQSGTSFAPFLVRNVDSSSPFRLAAHLGFVTDDLTDALAFLSTVDTNLVVAATSAAGIQARACVENEFENVERFITDQPSRINLERKKDVTVMVGFTNNERGASFEHLNPEDFRHLNVFAQMLHLFNFDSEHFADMYANVRQFYIGDEDITVDIKKELLDFVTDFGYFHPSYRRVQNFVKNGVKTIYHYVFSYDGGRNFEKKRSNITTVDGAVHEDEIGYLFDMTMLNETPTPEDQLTIDRITTLWTNFAKYSNPTPEPSDILPLQWPPITDGTRYYLNIGSEVYVGKRPFHSRMAFWDLFYKLNYSFP